MKRHSDIMGMPVTIEIVDPGAQENDIEEVFSYFQDIDEQFSLYKSTSEVEKINRCEIVVSEYSPLMQKILQLSEETKKDTQGYFDIYKRGKLDPSGLVKGFAIYEGTKKLFDKGYKNFFVEIAGDIQTSGFNQEGKKWRVGIRNPIEKEEIIKVVFLSGEGIATSGNYERGAHIYNPKTQKTVTDIASLTVISKTIYDADRFATAAFAMGEKGIEFINKKPELEGYMILRNKIAVYTEGFEKYTGRE
jgi:thiamine biosynthesis lipoprotein